MIRRTPLLLIGCALCQQSASGCSLIRECNVRLNMTPNFWNNCEPARLVDLHGRNLTALVARAHAALATMPASTRLLFFGDSLARDTFVLLACVLLPDLSLLPTGNTSSKDYSFNELATMRTKFGVRVDFLRFRIPLLGE
ncbi:hypothetical protein T492DRAFT_843753 [Pavlovales sp. CCMP2436]|nr:hypothetical protein T492DRAFT_843753 [Pavlovales sp. CCMP2436]